MKIPTSTIVKNLLPSNFDFYQKTLEQIATIIERNDVLHILLEKSTRKSFSDSDSKYHFAIQEVKYTKSALAQLENRISQMKEITKPPRFFELTEQPNLLKQAAQIATAVDHNSLGAKRALLNQKIVHYIKDNENKSQSQKLTLNEIVQKINQELIEVHGFSG